MRQIVPLEEEEQANFVEWLDIVGIKYTASANGVFTGAYFNGQKKKSYAQMAKMYRM